MVKKHSTFVLRGLVGAALGCCILLLVGCQSAIPRIDYDSMEPKARASLQQEQASLLQDINAGRDQLDAATNTYYALNPLFHMPALEYPQEDSYMIWRQKMETDLHSQLAICRTLYQAAVKSRKATELLVYAYDAALSNVAWHAQARLHAEPEEAFGAFHQNRHALLRAMLAGEPVEALVDSYNLEAFHAKLQTFREEVGEDAWRRSMAPYLAAFDVRRDRALREEWHKAYTFDEKRDQRIGRQYRKVLESAHAALEKWELRESEILDVFGKLEPYQAYLRNPDYLPPAPVDPQPWLAYFASWPTPKRYHHSLFVEKRVKSSKPVAGPYIVVQNVSKVTGIDESGGYYHPELHQTTGIDLASTGLRFLPAGRDMHKRDLFMLETEWPSMGQGGEGARMVASRVLPARSFERNMACQQAFFEMMRLMERYPGVLLGFPTIEEQEHILGKGVTSRYRNGVFRSDPWLKAGGAPADHLFSTYAHPRYALEHVAGNLREYGISSNIRRKRRSYVVEQYAFLAGWSYATRQWSPLLAAVEQDASRVADAGFRPVLIPFDKDGTEFDFVHMKNPRSFDAKRLIAQIDHRYLRARQKLEVLDYILKHWSRRVPNSARGALESFRALQIRVYEAEKAANEIIQAARMVSGRAFEIGDLPEKYRQRKGFRLPEIGRIKNHTNGKLTRSVSIRGSMEEKRIKRLAQQLVTLQNLADRNYQFIKVYYKYKSPREITRPGSSSPFTQIIVYVAFQEEILDKWTHIALAFRYQRSGMFLFAIGEADTRSELVD